MKDSKTRLVNANIMLGKELFAIKAALDIEKVIGLNVDAIQGAFPSVEGFFWLTQRQSQIAATVGLAKVFERENGFDLCSIPGIYRLAKAVPIEQRLSLDGYLEHYGITPSGNWEMDVWRVRCQKRSWVRHRIKNIISVRNTAMAHMQQEAPEAILPSDNDFRELLEYAFRFHEFVNGAFLHVTAHPILEDTKIQTSFVKLLKQIGVTNPELEYPD